MDSEKVIKRDNEYVLHTYGRNPVVLEKGHGLYAEGPEGQKYLDFTSGIGVNSLGYCDLTWAEAVSEQAHKLQHTSNLYYTAPCGKLAKKLCKRTGMSKVFFGNSGAEANEGAIKAARKYSFDHYGKGRDTIITLVNSFHGRTIATLTATGQEVFHQYFGPFNDGFQYVPAGDINSLTELVDRHTCAILLELVQGEGGVMPYGTGNRNRQCWNPQQRCQRNQIRQRQVAVPTGRHFAQSDPQHAYQQYDPQRNTHANPLEMAIIRRTKTANEHIQHSEFVRFG